MLAEPLGRTMTAVGRTLDDARVRPDQLDRVLLVGGSTRIPRIAAMLRDRLGHEPHGEVDPDLTVALGAATQAAREMGTAVDSLLVDITPYTFGTSAFGEVDGGLHLNKFVPLIRRNTRLPASRTESFRKVFDEQEAVEIDVYQGEDPIAIRTTASVASYLRA